MKEPRVQRKLSPEFKRAAVDRMVGGESPAALSRELGVKRELLYRWKDQGWGTAKGKPRSKEKLSTEELIVGGLQNRVAELEQLLGKQVAALDFFAAALRNVKEPRPNRGGSSELGSTARSNNQS